MGGGGWVVGGWWVDGWWVDGWWVGGWCKEQYSIMHMHIYVYVLHNPYHMHTLICILYLREILVYNGQGHLVYVSILVLLKGLNLVQAITLFEHHTRLVKML